MRYSKDQLRMMTDEDLDTVINGGVVDMSKYENARMPKPHIVTDDEAADKGDMGIAETAANMVEQTGQDASDSTAANFLTNTANAISGNLIPNVRKKALQTLAQGYYERSDGKRRYLEWSPEEQDYLLDKAFAGGWSGLARSAWSAVKGAFGGKAVGGNELMKEWEDGDGKKYERGTTEWSVARLKYAQNLARTMLGETVATEQNAQTEAKNRESTTAANIVAKGAPNLAYTASFLSPWGIALSTATSAAGKATGLMTDAMAYDEDGNLVTTAKGDTAGTAWLKGGTSALAETGVELAGGKIGGAIAGRALRPLKNAAGRAAGSTKIGQSVMRFGERIGNLFERTSRKAHLENPFEENLEEWETAMFDALLGTDKRESELKGTDPIGRFLDANKDFFTLKNLLEMNEAMLLTMGAGAFVAAATDRGEYRASRGTLATGRGENERQMSGKRVDDIIRAHDLMTDEQLKDATTEEKTAALNAWAQGLSEDEIRQKIDAATGLVDRLANRIEGRNKFADNVAAIAGEMEKKHGKNRFSDLTETSPEAGSFDFTSVPGVRSQDKDGNEITAYADPQSGVTVEESVDGDGDTRYRVRGANGAYVRSTTGGTYMTEAAEAAAVADKAAREQNIRALERGDKEKFLRSEIGRIGIPGDYEVVGSADELVKLVPGIENDKDYNPNNPAVSVPEGTELSDGTRTDRPFTAYVLDNIGTRDEATRKVIHEAGIHLMLDQAFADADDRAKFLFGIDKRAIRYGVDYVARNYGKTADEVLDDAALREEALAHSAEAATSTPTMLGKFVHAFREMARGMGAEIPLNDEELGVALREMRGKMFGSPEIGTVQADIDERKETMRKLYEQGEADKAIAEGWAENQDEGVAGEAAEGGELARMEEEQRSQNLAQHQRDVREREAEVRDEKQRRREKRSAEVIDAEARPNVPYDDQRKFDYSAKITVSDAPKQETPKMPIYEERDYNGHKVKVGPAFSGRREIGRYIELPDGNVIFAQGAASNKAALEQMRKALDARLPKVAEKTDGNGKAAGKKRGESVNWGSPDFVAWVRANKKRNPRYEDLDEYEAYKASEEKKAEDAAEAERKEKEHAKRQADIEYAFRDAEQRREKSQKAKKNAYKRSIRRFVEEHGNAYPALEYWLEHGRRIVDGASASEALERYSKAERMFLAGVGRGGTAYEELAEAFVNQYRDAETTNERHYDGTLTAEDILKQAVSEWRKYQQWVKDGARSAEEEEAEGLEAADREERRKLEVEDAQVKEYALDEIAAKEEWEKEYAEAVGLIESEWDETEEAKLSPDNLAKAEAGVNVVRIDHHGKVFLFAGWDAEDGILTLIDPDAEAGKGAVYYRVTKDGIQEAKGHGQRNETGAADDRAGAADAVGKGGVGKNGETGKGKGGELRLESASAGEIAAEEKRNAERKKIERRKDAPLKVGKGETGQSLLDLGGAEGEDLFNRTERVDVATDEFAKIKDGAKDAESLAAAVEEKAKEYEREAEDWEKREYKPTDRTVEVNGETRRVDELNEERRQKKVAELRGKADALRKALADDVKDAQDAAYAAWLKKYGLKDTESRRREFGKKQAGKANAAGAAAEAKPVSGNGVKPAAATDAKAANKVLGMDAALGDAELRRKMAAWEAHRDERPEFAQKADAAKAILAYRAAKGKADAHATEVEERPKPKAAKADKQTEGTKEVKSSMPASNDFDILAYMNATDEERSKMIPTSEKNPKEALQEEIRKTLSTKANLAFIEYKNRILKNFTDGDNDFSKAIRNAETVEDFIRIINEKADEYDSIAEDWAGRKYNTSNKRVKWEGKGEDEGITLSAMADSINEMRRARKIEHYRDKANKLREVLKKTLDEFGVHGDDVKHLEKTPRSDADYAVGEKAMALPRSDENRTEANGNVPTDEGFAAWATGRDGKPMAFSSEEERANARATFDGLVRRGRVDGKTGMSNVRWSIAGSKAINPYDKATAEEMERNGASRESIFDKVGLWRGRDGNWRVELPDITNATVANLRKLKDDEDTPTNKAGTKVATLSDLAYAYGADSELAALLKHYPDIGDVRLWLHGGKKTASGHTAATLLNPSDNYRNNGKRENQAVGISISLGRSDEKVRRSLVHELQHVIQGEEGWENGTTSERAGSRSAYMSNPGEVEARVAADRSAYDENGYAVGKKTYPWETEDAIAGKNGVRWSKAELPDGKKNADGENLRLLHDVTDIKDITDEVGSLSGARPKEASSIGEYGGIVAQDGAARQPPKWSKVTAEEDAAYADAVKRGDRETALRMVREAAGLAMENPFRGKDGKILLLHHGSNRFGETVFDKKGMLFSTDSESRASGYGGPGVGNERWFSRSRTVEKTEPIDMDTPDDKIVKKANSVLGLGLRLATVGDRLRSFDRLRKTFEKLTKKVDGIDRRSEDKVSDENFEFYNKTQSLMWDMWLDESEWDKMRYAMSNGNVGDYGYYDSLMRTTSDIYDRYKKARAEYYDILRGKMSDDSRHYYDSFFKGYEVGDAMIDAQFSFRNLLDENNKILRSDGTVADKRSLVDAINQNQSSGIYGFYADAGENPLVVNAKGAYWTSVPFNGKHMSTDEIGEWAKDNGYTSVRIDNVQDPGVQNAEGSDFITFLPSQVKSADPFTYDDAGKLIPLSERFNQQKQDIRWSVSPVYTGSAADYEKPSLVKVGTGEGSQVYGWGLYGSGVRGVAEGYAGQEMGKRRWQKEYNIQRKIESVSRSMSYLEGQIERDPTNDALRNQYAEKERRIKELQSEIDALPKQNVYEQTFFTNRAEGNESHLLSWYETVSEENKKRVSDALNKEYREDGFEWKWNGDSLDYVSLKFPNINVEHNAKNGGELYNRLVSIIGKGSPQVTSEFLARSDIDGIKYPVDSFGGKGVKDGDKVGWNYVSFRDDNIRVDHKWVDGKMRWSKAAPARDISGWDYDGNLPNTDEAMALADEYNRNPDKNKGTLYENAVRWSKALGTVDEALAGLRNDRFDDGETDKHGMETLHVVRVGDRVVKFRKPDNSADHEVDKVKMHNFLFPETAYAIKGFSQDANGRDVTVLEQPYVEFEKGSGDRARKMLLEEMRERFGKAELRGKEIHAGGWMIDDLKDANVGIDKATGRPAVIDCIIHPLNDVNDELLWDGDREQEASPRWSKEAEEAIPQDVRDELRGITQERINHYREKVGLPPLESKRRTLEEMEREGQGLFANRDLVNTVVDAVNKKPRALSEEETVAVGLAHTDALQQYEVKMAEVAEAMARGNKADEARLRTEADVILERTDAMEKALRASGSVTGRALALRRIMVSRNLTLAGFTNQCEALKGKKLTDEEKKDVATAYKAVRDAIAGKDGAVLRELTKRIRDAATSDVSAIVAEMKRRGSKSVPADVDGKFKDAVKQLVAWNDVSGGILTGLQGAKETVNGIIRYHVANGVGENLTGKAKYDAVMGATLGTVKQYLGGATMEELEQAVSGYGISRPHSLDETELAVRDMDLQAKRYRALADLLNRKLPKATGDRRAPTSDEVKRLDAEIREKANELKMQTGLSPEEMQKLVDKRLATLEKRLQDYRVMLMTENFKPKDKRAPRIVTPEIMAKEKEVAAAMKKVEERKRHYRAFNHPLNFRVGQNYASDWASMFLAAPRVFRTMLDFSATGAQGAALFVSHPVEGMKALGKSVAAFYSSKKADELQLAMDADPDWQEFQKFGGHAYSISDVALDAVPEEFRAADTSVKIGGKTYSLDTLPLGIGKAVRSSERSFGAFLNTMNLAMYKAMKNGGGWSDPAGPTDTQKRDLAEALNVASGYGYGREGKGWWDKYISAAFWAPSYTVAGVKQAVGYEVWSPFLRGGKDERSFKDRAVASKQLAKEEARRLASMAAWTLLATLLFGKKDPEWIEEILDPRSSHFGNVRIGNREVSFLGPMKQWLTFMSRMVNGNTVKNGVEKKTSPMESAGRIMRGKMSPLFGLGWDLTSGEDYIGDKIEWGRMKSGKNAEGKNAVGAVPHILESVGYPLSLNDVHEAIKEDGIANALLMAPFALTGFAKNAAPVNDYNLVTDSYGELSAKYRKAVKDDPRAARQMLKDNPELRDSRRIDDLMKYVRTFERQAKKYEDAGKPVPEYLTRRIEDYKRRAVEAVRKARQ